MLTFHSSSEPLVRAINITMPSRLGFHLRMVARFVKRVREFRSSIHIRKGKLFADGKSILGLLILGAAWKSKLEIKAVGGDAVQAIEGIREFFLNQENTSTGVSPNSVVKSHLPSYNDASFSRYRRYPIENSAR